jgi:hypothetical protein
MAIWKEGHHAKGFANNKFPISGDAVRCVKRFSESNFSEVTKRQDANPNFDSAKPPVMGARQHSASMSLHAAACLMSGAKVGTAPVADAQVRYIGLLSADERACAELAAS